LIFRGYDYAMMGRPKKPEGEVKNNVLRIRLTPAERAQLDRAAEAQGEDTSTWARALLMRAASKLAANRRGANQAGNEA
jgi:hypothetical protein